MEGITRLALTLATLAAAPVLPHAGDVFRPAPLASPVAPRDAWFGDDKFRHLAMSFAITSYGFAAARSLGMHEGAAPAAAAVGAAVGLAKELFDRRAGKAFSARDLVWDAAGVLAAYALVRNTR